MDTPLDPAESATHESRLAALERSLEEGLTSLRERLAAAESAQGLAADELAVLRLVASYSPRVDSGDADGVAELWTRDGVYDVDTGLLEGHEDLTGMVHSDAHQGLIAHGCGHVPGLPVVLLRGDRAVATGYTQLVVRSSTPGRYTVVRVTANRWELERRGSVDAPDRGWRVVLRTARAVTDDGEGRHLLGRSREG